MLLGPLSNEQVERSLDGFLIDHQGPHLPLVICFGAYEPARLPPFEFFGRLKKLEALTGQKLNKLLLRDTRNLWYHHGIPGLGDTLDQTVAAVQRIIGHLKPSRVITIGQSMGAFGALLFGCLLRCDRALAFGPMAVFSSAELALYSDRRWLDVVLRVEGAPPPVFHQDLARLIAQRAAPATQFHVFYGTRPTDQHADRAEGVNYDAVHAALLGRASPQVQLHPLPWSRHRVTDYLKHTGFIDEFMRHWVLGQPYRDEPVMAPGLTPELLRWMSINYAIGFDQAQLQTQMDAALPLPPGQRDALFAAMRRNHLRRVL